MSSATSDPTFGVLLERLKTGWKGLPDKPQETPEGTLACLWHLASGRRLALSEAVGLPLMDLDERQRSELGQLVERRLHGTPLAHLTERQDFFGVVMLASPKAMVPREETEILVHTALQKLQEASAENPLVIDLCTGSGNVALALAHHTAGAMVWGGDLSEDSIAFATENARFVGKPDVCFEVSDLTRAFRDDRFVGRVDLITCNPPYISSSRVESLPDELREFEPRMAFDGGPFGVSILFRIIKEGPDLLKPGGWLVMEIGLGQGDPMERRMGAHPAFDLVQTERDPAGNIRVIAARRGPVQ